MLVHMIW